MHRADGDASTAERGATTHPSFLRTHRTPPTRRRDMATSAPLSKKRGRPSQDDTIAKPQSTLREDLKSVKTWFLNLVVPTLQGRAACKPTMPAVIPTVIEELRQVMGPSRGKSNWTFVDCGCGEGTMLQPMRHAMLDGRSMFERVVGVELDPNTFKHAVRSADNDPNIEVVCGDMFPFVAKACKGRLFGGRAAFYIYEPLWMAGIPADEMERLYGGLLEAVAKHPGSIIVYCSADAYREISTELFESKGMVLMRKAQVAQNGAFNKLRGRYNPLELWQVPYPDTSSAKRPKK